jgi:hypothetical protein
VILSRLIGLCFLAGAAYFGWEILKGCRQGHVEITFDYDDGPQLYLARESILYWIWMAAFAAVFLFLLGGGILFMVDP